ncbi:hypothetical protein KAR91_15965 [Candidatus Pacearchaeota archaeon]|nr:hypothetical protein [Candidatus Pacearchaeota archaeon]
MDSMIIKVAGRVIGAGIILGAAAYGAFAYLYMSNNKVTETIRKATDDVLKRTSDAMDDVENAAKNKSDPSRKAGAEKIYQEKLKTDGIYVRLVNDKPKRNRERYLRQMSYKEYDEQKS